MACESTLIPFSEFEQRRHVAELCTWINQKLRMLESTGRFAWHYFERADRSVKALVEEAIPLSRLGLFLWTPGSDVFINCVGHSHNYDGNLEITGFRARDLRVEVTTTETAESTMRRQALSRDGTVVFSGPIHRQGREIVTEPAMIDVEEDNESRIALAITRLTKKLDSRQADGRTAILVHLSEVRLSPPEFRAELIRRTVNNLRQRQSFVPAVYYCFWNYHVEWVPWQEGASVD